VVLIFKKGEEITFNFLGVLCKGIIIDPVIQGNAVKVNHKGVVHCVGLTEKDNKYCFLIS
jgi:hypothetical protein